MLVLNNLKKEDMFDHVSAFVKGQLVVSLPQIQSVIYQSKRTSQDKVVPLSSGVSKPHFVRENKAKCLEWSGQIDYTLQRRSTSWFFKRPDIPSGFHLCGKGFTLQQDNELKHIKASQKLLENQRRPRSAADYHRLSFTISHLSLIEHLFDTQRQKSLTYKEAFWSIIRRHWDGMLACECWKESKKWNAWYHSHSDIVMETSVLISIKACPPSALPAYTVGF